MNDDINRGSSVYQRERDKALQRDDWECQACGRAVGHVGDQDVPVAHVHHDTELSEGGVHHVDNLTTLCPECHGDIHGSEVGERDFNEQPYRNEEWLREMYHGEELTQAKIADRAGCHRRTIATWFRRHDITGRSADQRKKVSNSGPWDDEEVLGELYIKKRLTIAEVADQLGTSEGTVRRRMDDFGIDRRDHMEYMRQGPVFLRFDTSGYLRAESAVDGEKDIVYIHQLVAIADGADPQDVFGGGQIHHQNHHRADNRPENLIVLSHEEHLAEHDFHR